MIHRNRFRDNLGWLSSFLLIFACTATSQEQESAKAPEEAEAPIPVIFDTDIGTDIDDTWALAQLLASPELDLRLVVTDSGDTETRARIVAKMLEAAGRTDVPIGIGVPEPEAENLPIGQAPWADDVNLDEYPGTVYRDGVGALIDVVKASEVPVTLLAVGPVPNLVSALEREPSLAQRVRVVAMSGSVDRGYDRAAEPSAEYNVAARVPAAKQLYGAGWDLLIAPLDTAGQLQVTGDAYRRLVESESRTVQALLEGYRVWEPTFQWGDFDVDRESSVLFDALAVALAYDESLCTTPTLDLIVTDDGFTRRDDDGKPTRVCLEWTEGARERLQDDLVVRLLRLP
ncbi:MAG: nucleoside hydrolase [Acidobacteriota bacterium]